MKKGNIQKILVICLIIFILLPIVIWKLVKTENYVTLKNVGTFPQNGYIIYPENNNIKNIVRKDKDQEYDHHMRYLREQEKQNSSKYGRRL